MSRRTDFERLTKVNVLANWDRCQAELDRMRACRESVALERRRDFEAGPPAARWWWGRHTNEWQPPVEPVHRGHALDCACKRCLDTVDARARSSAHAFGTSAPAPHDWKAEIPESVRAALSEAAQANRDRPRRRSW